jgi:predicted transcriptional regulator
MSQGEVLKIIKENPGITSDKIKDVLEIGRVSILRAIKQLRKFRFIKSVKVVGRQRLLGHYAINKEESKE